MKLLGLIKMCLNKTDSKFHVSNAFAIMEVQENQEGLVPAGPP